MLSQNRGELKIEKGHVNKIDLPAVYTELKMNAFYRLDVEISCCSHIQHLQVSPD